jgi:hypothetical protein
MQWSPALGAGLLAGAVLLLVPRGSPWSALTFFSPVLIGRTLPSSAEMPLPAVWAIHLGISVLYGFAVSWAVAGVSQQRAILAGGVVGVGLYIINFGVISLCWTALRGNEVGVMFTHIVFGLIAAGAYRGLLRRRFVVMQSPGEKSGFSH